ncbi:MAG: hypothetical protein RL397_1555 [Pseudomonadota bacterium]
MGIIFIHRAGRVLYVCAVFFLLAVAALSVQARESDWQGANRAVDEAGGWKAYLRESQAAQATSQATAFWPDRSSAHRAKTWQDFSQLLEHWLTVAMNTQPGLRRATDSLTSIAASDTAWLTTSESVRTILAQGLRVSRPLVEEVISWVYAQEVHQRLLEREDLADVAWELARRMHAVGNLPLQEEREARLHLLEIRAARQKAEARLLQAREAIAQHARSAGVAVPTRASAVLPLPPVPKPPADQRIEPDAMGRVIALIPRERRLGASRRAMQNPNENQGEGRGLSSVQPYALLQAYAALAHAEQQLRLATDRAQLLVEEGLPARQTISEEHLLAYNGMLIGTPKLLKDRDQAMGFELEVLEALRDYWLARSRRDHQQATVLFEEIFWGVAR